MCVCATCVRACMFVCVCVAKPVTVELRCHATALILVIGKTQFRRAMLSCDSSCYYIKVGYEGYKLHRLFIMMLSLHCIKLIENFWIMFMQLSALNHILGIWVLGFYEKRLSGRFQQLL